MWDKTYTSLHKLEARPAGIIDTTDTDVMTKETRANLIFVAVLIVLLLPGAIILVNKKMQPGEKGLFYLPTGKPNVAAYNDPMEKPGEERQVPNEVINWLDQVTASDTGKQAKTFRGRISNKRRFELLCMNQASEQQAGQALPFLITAHWQTQATPNLKVCKLVLERKVADSSKPAAYPLQPIETRTVAVPDHVLEALRDLHYVVPPRQIIIVAWDWPVDDSPDSPVFDRETWRSIQLQTGDNQVVDQISWD